MTAEERISVCEEEAVALAVRERRLSGVSDLCRNPSSVSDEAPPATPAPAVGLASPTRRTARVLCGPKQRIQKIGSGTNCVIFVLARLRSIFPRSGDYDLCAILIRPSCSLRWSGCGSAVCS